MSGKILNSRYELDQKLGGGGLGDTYLAFDLWKEDDNRCVVKQLRPGIVNATTLRLFEKEAEALSKLGSHDQIPTLWAHFQQDNQFYLVQEFIEGHDLTQEIKLGECWQETDVIKLLQDILEVLDFVHQNNVIHRDIKPGNIMRRQDGKIVLIDFGGVKQVKNNPTSRQSSVVIGTPGYMPYEQIYNNAQLGRNEEALASCEQAIQRDTDFADAWSNRGVALLKLGNYNEAIACCQRAIKINADEVIYFVNLAWVLYSCGRHDEALANYELELKIKPNDSKLWTYQGILLCELKKYQQADLSLKTAIKLDSNSALAHLYSGTVLFLSKSVAFEQLLELVEQAISIKQGLSNEHLVLAQLYKGICLSKLGKDEDAFATLNKLTNVRASDGLIYLVLYTCGEVLNKLRKYEEAIIYLDKSLTIQQNCEFAIKARKRAKKNLWKPLFLRRWESILMKYISLYSVSDLIILSPIAFIFLYFSPIIIAIPMLVILSISITLVKWSSPISRKP